MESKAQIPDVFANHALLGKYEYEEVDKETGEYSTLNFFQ